MRYTVINREVALRFTSAYTGFATHVKLLFRFILTGHFSILRSIWGILNRINYIYPVIVNKTEICSLTRVQFYYPELVHYLH